ncbi:MAG: hypothetical protein K2V38_02760, partial [Gemmataceae bacterium]|nr:hypothetical protein [Gemmataceae bacterium]
IFRSWDEALRSPARDAVRRVFVAWFELRDHELVVESGFQTIGRGVPEALPFLRKLLADEKSTPERRAQAAVLIGKLGRAADLALLRQVAESEAANKPHTTWTVIVSGGEELNFHFHTIKLGGKVTEEEWAAAAAKATWAKGDRSLADCAWAAAVKIAGGKPSELGFLYPHTVKNGPEEPSFFDAVRIHGFPDARSRAAVHAKAKAFLEAAPASDPVVAPAPRAKP